MGQNISQSLLCTYMAQLTGLRGYHKRDTAEEYFQRLSSLELIRTPYGTPFFLDHRCSFVEATLLGKKKSTLMNYLDQMEEVMVIGIEESGGFVGKHSLFCAWAAPDLFTLTDTLNWLAPVTLNGTTSFCVNIQQDRVCCAAPFKMFAYPTGL